MVRRGMRWLVVFAVAGLLAAGCSSGPEPVRVGALYPLTGSQGPGGVEEYHGAMLAADLANRDGGVGGRPIEIEPVDVPGRAGSSRRAMKYRHASSHVSESPLIENDSTSLAGICFVLTMGPSLQL